MIKKLYVAATSQHVGKTTSTLGLVATLKDMGVNVGYSKPVGQEFVDLGDLRVDKDALLFSEVIGFDLVEKIHSPVILGKGATSAYLDNPSAFDHRERILNARKELERKHDMIVYEGTGHPGVGSVVDLSNAEVAKILDAPVLMVVKGGIGNTIDRLMMSICSFQQKGVPVIGVIVNKVLPSKMEKIRKYIGIKLEQIDVPLLGLLPYDKSLSNPIMETVMNAVKGKIVANGDKINNIVEDIVSGSLVADDEFSSTNNHLLVVDKKRVCEAIEKIKAITMVNRMKKSPLSGIIVTGNERNSKSLSHFITCDDYITENRIPVISTAFDTFGSVVKISRIEVKINTRTPWKSEKAIKMIKKHVDLSSIVNGDSD